jgi:hypothetical protein
VPRDRCSRRMQKSLFARSDRRRLREGVLLHGTLCVRHSRRLKLLVRCVDRNRVVMARIGSLPESLENACRKGSAEDEGWCRVGRTSSRGSSNISSEVCLGTVVRSRAQWWWCAAACSNGTVYSCFLGHLSLFRPETTGFVLVA